MRKATVAPKGSEVAYVEIPTERLVPSPDNPRTRYDEAKLAELAASYAGHGILEPLVVRRWNWPERPLPQTIVILDTRSEVGGFYEIAAGHRRLRAAQIAGLKSVPCLVRDLSDIAMLEVFGIENAQREDLTPLEEALAFKNLLDRGGYDVAGIAAKIGRAEGYVRARLSIHRLQGKAREAMDLGLLTIAHALVLAPLTPEDQDAATIAALGPQEGDELAVTRKDYYNSPLAPYTPAQLRSWIRSDLTPDLEKAPFDKADPTLNPAMGACDACPFRTINGLFPEPGDEDRCLKRPCYETKVAVHLERARAAIPEGTLLVSSQYRRDDPGVLGASDYHALKRLPTTHEAKDEAVLDWALDELPSAEEIRVHSESFDALYVAIMRHEDPQSLVQGEEDDVEDDFAAFDKGLEGAHASGAMKIQDVRFVRDDEGLRCEALSADAPAPALPDDARMAFMLDGPSAGTMVPVRLYSSGQATVAKIEDPDAAKAESSQKLRERKEQLRLQRAEMIARRRALDVVLDVVGIMPEEVLQALVARHALDFVAIGAVKLARIDTSVWDSHDPKDGKHPGRHAAFKALGLDSNRTVDAKPDSFAFERPLRDAVKALALGATSDEIHVGDGYAGERLRERSFALVALCRLFEVDLDGIRKAADWDTLSKKQKAEREAAQQAVPEAFSKATDKIGQVRQEAEPSQEAEEIDAQAAAEIAEVVTFRPKPEAVYDDPRLADTKEVGRWACGYGQRAEPGGIVYLDDATFLALIASEERHRPGRAEDYALARTKGQIALWTRIFESAPDGATWPGLSKEAA